MKKNVTYELRSYAASAGKSSPYLQGNNEVTEQVKVFEQERFYGYLKTFHSKIVTGVQ